MDNTENSTKRPRRNRNEEDNFYESSNRENRIENKENINPCKIRGQIKRTRTSNEFSQNKFQNLRKTVEKDEVANSEEKESLEGKINLKNK